MGWPAIRTPRQLSVRTRARAVTFGVFASVLLVPLFGLSLVLLSYGFDSDTMMQIGGIMIYTLIVTLPLMVLAVPAAWLAATTGYAGWAVAILSGGIAATAPFYAIDSLNQNGMPSTSFAEFFVPFTVGMFFGGLFWLGAKFGAPDAFMTTNTHQPDDES